MSGQKSGARAAARYRTALADAGRDARLKARAKELQAAKDLDEQAQDVLDDAICADRPADEIKRLAASAHRAKEVYGQALLDAWDEDLAEDAAYRRRVDLADMHAAGLARLARAAAG